MTTTTTMLYALFSPSPNSVVHRIPAPPDMDYTALCGFHPMGWYSLASAPRELPGQHRECRVCKQRAMRPINP